MDDQSSGPARSTTAVVREFVASRLERELLAEAFELAWTKSPAVAAGQGASASTAAETRSFPLRKGA
jgi:hypothetical protein